MALYYAKNKMVPAGWAQIKRNGSLTWSKHANATAFPTPEAAEKAAVDAIGSAFAKAWADMPEGAHRSWRWSLPGWMRPLCSHAETHHGKCPPEIVRSVFSIDAAATPDEALGVFDLFYARCSKGWLGGPKTKAAWGSHAWREGFSSAEGFASAVAASEAAAAMGEPGVSILKATAAFTRAELPQGAAPDELSQGVHAACEAREGEIVAAARSRMEASASAPAKATGRRL